LASLGNPPKPLVDHSDRIVTAQRARATTESWSLLDMYEHGMSGWDARATGWHATIRWGGDGPVYAPTDFRCPEEQVSPMADGCGIDKRQDDASGFRVVASR